MTREQKYLAFINRTVNEPGVYDLRQLMKAFRLRLSDAEWITKTLRLEVKGYNMKNKKEEIYHFIKNHPLKTAIEISKELNCSIYLVYAVARKHGISLQNKYSLKRIAA